MKATIKTWDLATRLYHWIQAIVFIALITTGFSGATAHIALGLVLLTLITWRILWGFWGSETNRFTQFIRSPRATIRYLFGQSHQKVGHNPAGGWMVITLIIAILLQCISGLALAGLLDHLPMAQQWLTDDVFAGFESLHLLLARVLPILVAVHLGAILVYKLKKKPLVWAMVTGVQSLATHSHGAETHTPYFVSNRRAFLMLVAAGLVTMTIIASSMV